MDCGAYRGDKIETFVKQSGGHYKKIIAFEPDPTTFAVLENFVRERGYKNIQLINGGVSDKNTQCSFDSKNNMSSHFSNNGNCTIPLKRIDDVVGNEPVSLIKMDVETYELRALNGAMNTIKRDKPVLAISAEHRSEDLITLPQYIKSLYGGYKVYLRKHSLMTEWDIDIYAIP